jgi:hypothetical protein
LPTLRRLRRLWRLRRLLWRRLWLRRLLLVVVLLIVAVVVVLVISLLFFLRVCFGMCVCWFVGWLPQKLQSKEPAILFGVLCSCTGTISVTLSGPTTHLVKSAIAGGDTMVRNYNHVRHYKPKPMSLLCLI